MATESQIRANHKNSRRSRGPKTALGKNRASQNALKHGLTARRFLLSNEDSIAFAKWRSHYIKALAPEGFHEKELADRIILCAWRLARGAQYERILVDDPGPAAPNHLLDALPRPLRTGEYDGPPPDPAELEAKIRKAFESGLYDRLTLYEQRAERAYHHALAELQRLQKIRKDEANSSNQSNHPKQFPKFPRLSRP